MMPTRQGSFHLFRLAGIDLFLHWSWFLVAAYQLTSRERSYTSPVWNVLEYLTLFGIVLLHEFGHALACRQVGGQADLIVLWPLGGVAYVNPPPRPGAQLWSIAAGPLVNVALIPVLIGLSLLAKAGGGAPPDVLAFLRTVSFINLGLLCFNMLPVYPLDGGQILRSLLWYACGRTRSLQVASAIGLAGSAGLLAVAFWSQSMWLGILSVFIALGCWRGFGQARVLSRVAALPLHAGFACPSCRMAPPQGAFWQCGKCRQPFDTFLTGAVCPHCGASYPTTTCVECGRRAPFEAWLIAPPKL
ncbi:MAG: peptidase M50 [Proteobacteria bacterium]|nr:peptidase M50 [Pseudomonadota bacterium]